MFLMSGQAPEYGHSKKPLLAFADLCSAEEPGPEITDRDIGTLRINIRMPLS